MSPLTGTSFLLCGVCLWLVLPRRPVADSMAEEHASSARVTTAGVLGGVVVFGNLLILMGYLYQVPPILGGGLGWAIALPTALAFLLFVGGLYCLAGPASFPLRLFVGPSTQALLLRAFLPLTVGTLLVDGILRCRM